jgi:Family of unknown function (DUF6236)
MVEQNVYRPLPTPALYYPYADFQSEAWVKLALINWYRVERIKPVSYPYNDRAVTQRLFDSGWLQDITPSKYQLGMAKGEFYHFLAWLGKRRQARYAVDKRDGWPKSKFGTTPRGADKRLAYVYAGSDLAVPSHPKMHKDLRDVLDRRGLGLIYEADGAMWLGLHPRLASVYMITLTWAIADDRQLVPVTDDEAVHRAAGRSTLDRLEKTLRGSPKASRKPSPAEAESQYVEIALRSVLNPVNLDEVSIESVIEFRGTHEAELRAFQSHVFDLREEILKICQISDAGEIQSRLHDLYKDRTEPELMDLQKKLHRFGIRSVPGFLALRIDKETAIQTIGGIAAVGGAHFTLGPAAPVAVPFAISVVAIPYIRRRRQELVSLEHESPASLLLAVKREFGK